MNSSSEKGHVSISELTQHIKNQIQEELKEESQKKFTYEFEMASLTSDVIVYHTETREILIIERQDGQLALPGGYVDIKDGETFLECAQRELKEETGYFASYEEFKEIGVFDSPDRDPRGRTITKAFYVEVVGDLPFRAGDDAVSLMWIPHRNLMHLNLHTLKTPKEPLAFDHNEIVTKFVREHTEYVTLSTQPIEQDTEGDN